MHAVVGSARRSTAPQPVPRAALASAFLVALMSSTVACTGDDGSATAASTSEGTTGESAPGTDASTTGASAATTDPSASGSGSGGAMIEPAPCEDASECQLVDDCCTCAVIGEDDAPPECTASECLATVCAIEGLHVPEPACRVGHCSFSPVRCSGPVACDADPPQCAPDERPSIIDDCWGACVAARYCDAIDSCDGAPCGEGWFCVETQSGAPARCHPRPPSCDDAVTCGCVFSYLPELCQASCGDIDADTLLCEDGG